jgi:conjugative relaxase-like TrwC/TraI family protein
MLATKAQYSLSNAEEYFKEHLQVGDYYMEGRRVVGQWIGQGSESLGLSGVTHTDEFLKLCRNLHPTRGERLTQRHNGTRMEAGKDGNLHEVANRRVFFDFTFSPPKSVSIAALVGDDRRILEAHDEAAQVALRQLEIYAATRVRKDGETSYRLTGNLVGAVFRHDTSRALDPHLHTHCILFNATRDSVENRWKALETCQMLNAKKFTVQVYYHELTKALVRFGYGIENNPRGDFEIRGVSQELIGRFSKRHQEIDRKTRELLAREPEKAGRNINAIRDHIAHKERARKIKDLGIARLQSLWDGQLSSDERAQLTRLDRNPPFQPDAPKMTAAEAVTWAEDHLFDRRSVVREQELWRHALEHARGRDVSLAEIQAVTKERGYVRDAVSPGRVTTREVLGREWEIVCLAREGMRSYRPLCARPPVANPALDKEQRQAVNHILASRDFVTLFRGGAGTGKSYTLREVDMTLRRSGWTVQVLAPQRQQVIGLERDGFMGAQTLSAFLARGSLARGAVVMVDEAGQIGGKQMLELLRLVKQNEGHVVLSGDTHQHGAVEATDALRAIEKYSGLEYAELTSIRRQNPDVAKTQAERKWLEQYRLAVGEAQAGKLAQSFDRLDKQDAIVACTLANQQQKLTERFLELVKANHSTVVVSQSWSEIHKVNERVRDGLKAKGLVGQEEITVTALERLDLTDAQKRDARSYTPDSVVVFNRPVSGYKPGASGRLLAVTDKHLLIEANQRIRPVPFKDLDRLTVCQPKELPLSSGDRLQLKSNGNTTAGSKVVNGELVTVKQVHPDGRIALVDGRTLDKSYRQFVRGYAVTSYAAQGKTVDFVLFSDSAVQAATNDQQWYVTISRGRKGVQIFTADKIQLRQNVVRSGGRELALDIAKESVVQSLAKAWGRDIGYVLSVQHSQCRTEQRRAELLGQAEAANVSEPAQQTETPKQSESVRQSPAVRTTRRIIQSQQYKQRHGGGIGV